MVRSSALLPALLVLLVNGLYSPARAQPPALSKDRLVRLCQLLYAPQVLMDDAQDEQAAQRRMEQWEKQARTELNGMDGLVLKRSLETKLKSLHSGSWAYTSVAYVLALRGFEVERNARRMTLNWTLPFNPKNNNEQRWAGSEGLGAALGEIYRRHPSDALLDIILKLQGDAAGSMILGLTKQKLLLLYPRSVLRVAAGRKRVLLELASDLTTENGSSDPISKRIRVTLQTMTRRGRPAETQAARFLLRRLAREYAGDDKERLDNDGR